MMLKRIVCVVVASLALSMSMLGCGKSDSASSGEADSANTFSGMERDAYDAVMAEIARHGVKGANGWTSAITSGSPFAPDHFLRQFREITVENIESLELGDSDRMNGFEWAGEVSFKKVPCREAGDSGIVLDGMANIMVDRQRGRWTQWIEYMPRPVKVQKVHGKWQIDPDTTLLHGQLPTPQDYANAGVSE